MAKEYDDFAEHCKKIIKEEEEKRRKYYEALGMSEEAFHEMMETQDEILHIDASIEKEYYILSEEEATKDIRVELSELKKYIPIEEIRKDKISYTDKECIFVQTPEGEYYSDYIEEKGIHLLSVRLYEYIKKKVFMRDIERNTVVLVGEGGKRQEEYKLLIPDTIDCILEGSEKYDKTGKLIYFEIDPMKAGESEIFKVKDFPHIVLRNKLNRIRYSGFKCMRIENHFKYEKEQGRKYKRRKTGEELKEALKNFEKQSERENEIEQSENFKKVYDSEKIRRRIREGLEKIYESYSGAGYGWEKSLDERFIMFFWSRAEKRIELSEEQGEEYGVKSIELDMYEEIEKAINEMPLSLKKEAEKLSYECLLEILIEESEIFRKYKNIHNENRLRIYIKEEMSLSMVPDIIYDYKTAKQEEIESLTNYTGIEFKNMNLSNYDLSNKDLRGKRFENCNMSRINLSKSNLEGCEIIKCNLTGAEFVESNLKKSRLIENDIDRAKFIGADLSESTHESNRPENHADYTKANLTGAKIKSERLYYNYFINSKLKNAELNIDYTTLACVFIGSDMRNIVVEGRKDSLECVIEHSDLRNTNLKGGKFVLNTLIHNNFVKSVLDNMDLEILRKIVESDFKWSSFKGTSLGKKEFIENDFTFVDLTKIKEKKNISFIDNNLTYTNLSGFDFVEELYMFANRLVYTDMSNCEFEYANFKRSEVIQPNLKGAKLKDAAFYEKQLKYVELSESQKAVIYIEEDKKEDDADVS